MRSIIELLNPNDVSQFLVHVSQLPMDLRSNFMLSSAMTVGKDRLLFRRSKDKTEVSLGSIILLNGVIAVALGSFGEKLEYDSNTCTVTIDYKDYKVLDSGFQEPVKPDGDFIYVKVANSGKIDVLSLEEYSNCFIASEKASIETITSCIVTDTQLDLIKDKEKAYDITKYLSAAISKDFQIYAKCGVVTEGAIVTALNIENWLVRSSVALTVLYTFVEDGIGYVVVKDGHSSYAVLPTTALTGYH